MKITYKNVDISNSITLMKCVHDMHASGQADTLRIMIDDETKHWDKWSPKKNDEIRILSDDVDTGTMFVSELSYDDGFLYLTAASVPESMFSVKTKTWQDVTFLRVAKDIAGAHGLTLKSYSVEDKKYKILQQQSETDAQFFNRRCILEGCSFLVYNKQLILYAEKAMEEKAPVKTLYLEDRDTFKLSSRRHYGACYFERGQYKGNYKNGSGRICAPDFSFQVSSGAEANRFAKNYLRYANKDRTCGYKEAIGIDKGITPGSVIEISNTQAMSWNGSAFVYRVRNDYINNRTKIFFRKPLEGY